jgi:O-acetyl-ADP-ribose deacetylase (regulator of RNase III)
MNIEYRTGNLFHQTDLLAWGHGVNCAGAMGRGIAVSFKAFFPEMFEEYASRCRLGVLKPGDVFAWEAAIPGNPGHPGVPDGRVTIYNLATQPDWKHSATLTYITKAVERMAFLAVSAGIKKIGIPRIGAGLGGLGWMDVEVALLSVCAAHKDLDVTLVVVTP